MIAALPVNFAPQDAATETELPSLRLTLEAEQTAGTNRANFRDIESMLSRARSGLSARSVQRERCPAARILADGTLQLTLAVIVWPSRPELKYTVSIPGEPGKPEITRRTRQWKFWTGGSSRLALPWMLENATCDWQPGFSCVDEFCTPVPPPAIRHEYADIYLERGAENRSAYGVLVVRGTAVGFRHPFTVDFAKFDDDGQAQSISVDSLPVSASWIDENMERQTEKIDVPVPLCAKDLLEACDDGTPVFSHHVNRANEGHWEIAYNTCDGRILGKRLVK